MGEMDGSGSSTASWGQSSKRKLREGACSQSHPSGNTGSFTQNPNNVIYGGPCNNTFNAIDCLLFPWPCTDSSATQLNQGNASQSDAHLPLQRAEDAEYSLRNLDRLGSLRNPQDFLLFDSSLDENARQPNVHMFEPAFQPQNYTGLPGFRSHAVVRPHSMSPQIESEDFYISLSSNGAHTLRQRGSSGSRTGDLATVHNFGRNRSVVSHDGNYAFIPATESRNLGQDPTNWSSATGPNNPSMLSSTSHSRIASNSRTLSPPPPPPPPQIRHQNPPSLIHQRFSEVAPWTLFPYYDADTRNQNSRSPPLPSFSFSSTSEAMISTRLSSHNEQQAHRRLRPLAEAVSRLTRPSREMAADIEGRHMLFSEIREVLGGARMGDNIRMEDYMLFATHTCIMDWLIGIGTCGSMLIICPMRSYWH